MTLKDFLQKLDSRPAEIEFEDSMQIIEDYYSFESIAFNNGPNFNAKGSNEGSCKIFAFAKLNNLTTEQTLACFGKYYREDVLQHPENDDHGNIRQFIITGLDGIQFSQNPLTPN